MQNVMAAHVEQLMAAHVEQHTAVALPGTSSGHFTYHNALYTYSGDAFTRIRMMHLHVFR